MKSYAAITQAERDAIVDRRDITLNGMPAKVIGRLERFPRVATLSVNGLSLEYCWQTVKMVCDHDGGAFVAK